MRFLDPKKKFLLQKERFFLVKELLFGKWCSPPIKSHTRIPLG